jgi:hypothetical protein
VVWPASQANKSRFFKIFKPNIMKRLLQTWCLLAILSASLLGLAQTTLAQPSTSPSALAAAKLKHRPPQNWIRHYLGDDRYKIAGGVWKVVSTELDRYYYPAWAPEMLRQKPGIVIGFSSAAEAEEAGYMPSGYPMGQSLYGLTSAEILAAKQRGALPGVQTGTRITLSDGRSSVILPRGWTHTRMASQSAGAGATYQADMISPTGGKSGVFFAFINVPGQNLESQLNSQSVSQMNSDLQQQSRLDGRIEQALKGARFTPATLGGMKGFSFVPGEGAQLPPGMGGRMIMVARGSKLYMMGAQLPTTDKNYGVIVNSFQPR